MPYFWQYFTLCSFYKSNKTDFVLQVITKMGFVSNKDEEVMKCLRDMDLDGDGRVSYAEFMVKWKIT